MDGNVRIEIGRTENENFRSMENLQEAQKIRSINPINLNYYGREQCEPGYTFGPFTRTNYTLHIVSRGKGILLKSGGRQYQVSAGQAFLIYLSDLYGRYKYRNKDHQNSKRDQSPEDGQHLATQ